uniref:Uncharacterized protein n=1 Tax=Vitis vinifera TaxID=29760 RepID=A5C1W8_VITVI|nr:hypothetical protein VITISV_001693 [Vitis vinifera]
MQKSCRRLEERGGQLLGCFFRAARRYFQEGSQQRKEERATGGESPWTTVRDSGELFWELRDNEFIFIPIICTLFSSSPVSGTCSWGASLFPFLPVGAKSYRGYIFSGEWAICCRMRAVVRRAYSMREEAEIIERYGELEKQAGNLRRTENSLRVGDKLRQLSYRGANVFLLVFSLTNKASYENIAKKWVPELRRYAPGIPIILVGTRLYIRDGNQFFIDHLGTVPIITAHGGGLRKLIGALAYIECSSKIQQNVKAVSEAAIKNTRYRPRLCGVPCELTEGFIIAAIMEGGIKLDPIVCITERIPQHDMDRVKAALYGQSWNESG